jgi:hypothetical protein
MQFDIGMLFVVIGFSTYSPNTCYRIKYKYKGKNLLFCLFTTCFGPYGPSSGVPQHHLYIYENHHTTAHPLFYNYSPIWCSSLIIYLSTLQSYNGNSLRY